MTTPYLYMSTEYITIVHVSILVHVLFELLLKSFKRECLRGMTTVHVPWPTLSMIALHVLSKLALESFKQNGSDVILVI